jgi:hypothetical protein
VILYEVLVKNQNEKLENLAWITDVDEARNYWKHSITTPTGETRTVEVDNV